jgi:HSP20 family protein
MSLVKYSTNYDDYAAGNFNGFLNRFFNDQQLSDTKNDTKFLPNTDVIELAEAFELQVALPGVKKEEVTLDVADNVLTIKGERIQKNEKEEGKYYSFETQYGTFKRSFRLPKNVDQTKIEASFSDGILTITLSKIAEDKLKTAIKIK